MLGVETATFAYALAAAVGLTGLIAASELVADGSSRLFLKGLLVQLLNPKIAIFFLAFLPQFVDSSGGPVAAQILVLGTIFT